MKRVWKLYLFGIVPLPWVMQFKPAVRTWCRWLVIPRAELIALALLLAFLAGISAPIWAQTTQPATQPAGVPTRPVLSDWYQSSNAYEFIRPTKVADDGLPLIVSGRKVYDANDHDGLGVQTAYRHKYKDGSIQEITASWLLIQDVEVIGGYRSNEGAARGLHVDLLQVRGHLGAPILWHFRDVRLAAGPAPANASMRAEVNCDGRANGIIFERVSSDVQLKLKVQTPYITVYESPGLQVKIVGSGSVGVVHLIRSPGAVVRASNDSIIPAFTDEAATLQTVREIVNR